MKNLMLTTCLVLVSVFASMAQETHNNKNDSLKKEKVYFKVKDGANPDVYIDGKKYDYSILELLDQDKIESVSVIKGEQAVKEYNAPNGVLLITSKQNAGSKVVIRNTDKKHISGNPKILIDGKASSHEELSKINPDDIYSINVIKDEKALKEYDSPDGVIIVTTKKGEKQKNK